MPENLTVHHVLGFVLCLVIIPTTLSGSATAAFGRLAPIKKWEIKKDTHNDIAKYHKLEGYFVLIFGVTTASAGIETYQ